MNTPAHFHADVTAVIDIDRSLPTVDGVGQSRHTMVPDICVQAEYIQEKHDGLQLNRSTRE